MKKSSIFLLPAAILMTLTFASCAGNTDSTTEAGYSDITFARDLMPPATDKAFSIGGLTDTALDGQCLSVAYSGTWDDTNYTAFAISSQDGTKKLTFIIKDITLADGVTSENVTLDSSNVIARYIEISTTGANSINKNVSGSATATISKTEGTDTVTTAADSPHTYYVTTISIDTSSSFSIGGLTISNGDYITAMHYPQAEPDMTE